MSLPDFSTQAELFSTAGLSASLFAPTDRYRLFAKLVFPRLAAARASLEKCYCPENGRVALEPVLMLGTSILQFLDGVPDRQAVVLGRRCLGHRKTAPSRWPSFKSMWRNARRFVRPEKPVPSAVAWSKSPRAR